MGIEDDFYATIKLKSGEEVFAKVAASEEEDRTMLIIHSPVTVAEIKNKGGLVGYKVEPWLKTTREDMFIINMDSVITLSESSDMEMIVMYQHYLRDSQREYHNQHRLNRRMGYISNVNDAKENLEKIFKKNPKEPKD
jgi:hypothetical protein|tara:strand:+ start:101 stop:514 length:414 start_codon:yes stop_codon:yes gene_type:complete